MRLLHAPTLLEQGKIEFSEFYEGNSPPYLILSHTWVEGEEVTFEDCKSQSFRAKGGFFKIRKTCEIAQAVQPSRIDYVWVDTCCIDKSSSAELSEAINSMFKWYAGSSICIAHLSDASDTGDDPYARLSQCRWFTRGWTLQELLAPRRIDFYGSGWEQIGTRDSHLSVISRITGIDGAMLFGQYPLGSASVAERMSWAARRTTTRVEDEAYCLLGVFGINMPLLYGEGTHAFRRLQEEILRSTYDLSLLAWTPLDKGFNALGSFLAPLVRCFADCADMVSNENAAWDEGQVSITSKGLHLRAQICVLKQMEGRSRYALDVQSTLAHNSSEHLAVPMRKIGPDTFVRNMGLNLVSVSKDNHILQDVVLVTNEHMIRPFNSAFLGSHYFIGTTSRFSLVELLMPPSLAMGHGAMRPIRFWDAEESCFFGTRTSLDNWGAIYFRRFIFLCFWSVKDDKGSLEHYAIRKDLPPELPTRSIQQRAMFLGTLRLFLFAESPPHLALSVRGFLQEMKTAFARDTGPGFIVTAPFQVKRVYSADKCYGPRWTVDLSSYRRTLDLLEPDIAVAEDSS